MPLKNSSFSSFWLEPAFANRHSRIIMVSSTSFVDVVVRPFSVSGSRSRERRQQTEGARLLSSAAAGLVLCVVAITTARFSGSYVPVRTGLMATELDAAFSAGVFQQLQEGNGTEVAVEAPASEAPASEGAAAEGAAAEGAAAEEKPEGGKSIEEHLENKIEGMLGMQEEGGMKDCPDMSRLPNGKCPPKPHLFGGMGQMVSDWMIIVVLLPLLGMVIYFCVECYWGLEGRMQAYKLPQD